MTVVTMSSSGAIAQDSIPVGDEMEMSISDPASPAQDFDLDEAIMQLVGPTIERNGEPVFDEKLSVELYKSIKLVMIRYKRYSKGVPNALDAITEAKMDDFNLWLYGVYQNINSKTNSSFFHDVKSALETMQSPTIQLPAEYQLIAAALMANFVAEPVTIDPEPAASGPPKKRQKKAGTSRLPGEVTLAPTRKADPNHPIFGDTGIMRGIWIRIKQKKTYLIDPEFKKDFRVFGHNQLEIGSVWPRQVAACRDGAHGAPLAGISGTIDDGCYSVVVSGMYSEIDKDHGDVIKYSSPGSLETNSKADIKNANTRALLRSIVTGLPIRVLRTAGGHWEGTPSAGIRYDGLYTAEDSTEKTKSSGGAYILFTLRRREGQPPIDRSRPNQKEKDQFELVGEGF